jgi:hypothetical protein
MVAPALGFASVLILLAGCASATAGDPIPPPSAVASTVVEVPAA